MLTLKEWVNGRKEETVEEQWWGAVSHFSSRARKNYLMLGSREKAGKEWQGWMLVGGLRSLTDTWVLFRTRTETIHISSFCLHHVEGMWNLMWKYCMSVRTIRWVDPGAQLQTVVCVRKPSGTGLCFRGHQLVCNRPGEGTFSQTFFFFLSEVLLICCLINVPYLPDTTSSYSF